MGQVSHIFVPNRGEVVTRIRRTCHRLGVTCTALESDTLSDYLHVPTVIQAAKVAGADAIHPGWGFLSEQAHFAQAVMDTGLTWIGPSPKAMQALGDKALAKARARDLGIPTLESVREDDPAVSDFVAACIQLGFPLMLKPLAGGGGKGMFPVHQPSELADAIVQAKEIAQSAFSDARLMAERLIPKARHVEVQVLGDHHGRLITLGERDCTVQRRSQKIFEEAPAPGLSASLRTELWAAARSLCESAAYHQAGTVEFLLEGEHFYFMEVNTRLQVEHGVTEELLDLDLIELQIRLARGEPLTIDPTATAYPPHRHVIQARLYSEDPFHEFRPSTGTLHHLCLDPLPHTRLDSGVSQGDRIDQAFDPMLMKVIARGDTREQAIAHLKESLLRLEPLGVTTNLAALLWTLDQEAFVSGGTDTRWLERSYEHMVADLRASSPTELLMALAHGLTAQAPLPEVWRR